MPHGGELGLRVRFRMTVVNFKTAPVCAIGENRAERVSIIDLGSHSRLRC